MARGSVVGEGIVSQAQSKAFDEGADRIGLGKSETAKERGVFVWDPKQQKLVRPWEVEMDETRRAIDAPIMAGRFYENTPSPIDGHVFTSRADHKRYCKERNLTTIDDYNGKGGAWDRAEAKRAQGMSAPEHRKARQEAIGRRLYEVSKMPQKQYERQVREAAERRARRGTATPTDE